MTRTPVPESTRNGVPFKSVWPRCTAPNYRRSCSVSALWNVPSREKVIESYSKGSNHRARTSLINPLSCRVSFCRQIQGTLTVSPWYVSVACCATV